jgi:short-subunit dehydrogenase
MNKTALIIGTTSSLGKILCRQLAGIGYNLILSGRDEKELSRIASDIEIRYDIQVKTAFLDLELESFCAKSFLNNIPKFDSIFLIAGYMGNDEKENEKNISDVININYLNPAKILSNVANDMQMNKKGEIVIISSVAGDRGRQSNYLYGSSKSAITVFASGLRNRLYKFSVHVMTVKPGFIDTPMTYGMNSPLIASREYVASKIIKSIKSYKDEIYVPYFWKFIMLIIKNIPERIFKKLSL